MAMNPAMRAVKYLSFGVRGRGTIVFDGYGIRHGWCQWPLNFDPVWIVHCPFFQQVPARTPEGEPDRENEG
jgi:hypothetical protein